MQIVQYAKDHPVITTIIVVVGGIVFYSIVSGGGSSSSSGSSGPSDTQIAADAQIQAAKIGAQAQAAQAGAAVQAAQIGAGVQLNSDNKAAEIMMMQITAARDLQRDQAQLEAQTAQAAIANIGKFGGKGAYDEQKAAALQTIFSKQNAPIPIKQSNPGNSASAIIGSLGGLAQGLGSIFSDANLKENIRHVGFDKKGRDIYAYNYKGSARIRQGYIAQQIERSEGGLVIADRKTGFKKVTRGAYA